MFSREVPPDYLAFHSRSLRTIVDVIGKPTEDLIAAYKNHLTTPSPVPPLALVYIIAQRATTPPAAAFLKEYRKAEKEKKGKKS